MDRTSQLQGQERLVRVASGSINLEGNLRIPETAHGVVLFAHGSGSSRHSPRNRYVAQVLNQAGLATLLLDLLTSDEEAVDSQTGHLRFNINFLAQRLLFEEPGALEEVARLARQWFELHLTPTKQHKTMEQT